MSEERKTAYFRLKLSKTHDLKVRIRLKCTSEIDIFVFVYFLNVSNHTIGNSG